MFGSFIVMVWKVDIGKVAKSIGWSNVNEIYSIVSDANPIVKVPFTQ